MARSTEPLRWEHTCTCRAQHRDAAPGAIKTGRHARLAGWEREAATSVLLILGGPCQPVKGWLLAPMILRSWLRWANPRISMLPKNLSRRQSVRRRGTRCWMRAEARLPQAGRHSGWGEAARAADDSSHGACFLFFRGCFLSFSYFQKKLQLLLQKKKKTLGSCTRRRDSTWLRCDMAEEMKMKERDIGVR